MAGRRLLLAEDSSLMRRMLASRLEEEGYEVITAVDGKEALEKTRQQKPELILTDFEMPELDGAALCRAIKEDPELRKIPVLMLTSLGEITQRVQGLDAGADDYIQKPKNPEEFKELFARIRAHQRVADLQHELDQRNLELEDRNFQLEEAHKKLKFELELARKVQLGLMPHPPQPRGVLRVAVRYTPANQLGGDVYDFYRLEKSRLGILVADVSGHGVNSALLSGVVKALAVNLSIAVIEPGELLAGLDVAAEQFFPEGYFCTGFYLVADEETGLIRYAGVGHPPAIVVGPNGPRTLRSNPGMIGIGMVEGTANSDDRLSPGESLIVYTDGLPDAMDPADEVFGEDRLKTVLQTHHGADPSEILRQIDKAVEAHVSPGQASDDINIIVVQYPPH
jgi:phosphoserine phosphatase RsbU/P